MQQTSAHGISMSSFTAAAHPPGPGPVQLHSLALNRPVLASELCFLPLRHQLLSSWGFRVRRPVIQHSALDDSRKWFPLSIQSPSNAPASAKPLQATGLASPFQRFPVILLHPFSWQLIWSDVIALFLIFILHLRLVHIFSLPGQWGARSVKAGLCLSSSPLPPRARDIPLGAAPAVTARLVGAVLASAPWPGAPVKGTAGYGPVQEVHIHLPAPPLPVISTHRPVHPCSS